MADEFNIDDLPELSPQQAATIDGIDLNALPEIRPSPAKSVLGTGLNILDTALLGAGDEIVSGLQAPIRAGMEGIPLSEAYNKNLDITRQTMAGFREENPWTSAGLGVVGGIISPASRLGFGGGSIAKNIGTGAVQGGVYGFNSGEGDYESRADTGGKGMVTGGAIGGAVGLAGKAMRSLAEAAPEARLSRVAQAMGITKADWKRAADKGRGISQGEDDEALTILDRAVRYVDDNFDVGKLDKKELQSALAKARAEKGSEIGAILAETDAALAAKGKKVFPDLADLKEEFSGENANVLKSDDVLEKLKSAVNTYKEKLSGTVQGIENQKKAIQNEVFEKRALSGYDPSLDRKISTSLKKATESIVEAEKGTDKKKAFQAAKEAYANLQIVEQLAGFANYVKDKGAADEEFFKMFKTSGGKLTSPTIMGGNTGEAIGQMVGAPGVGRAAGILAGLGIGGASYGANTDAGRRLLIQALKKTPGLVQGSSQFFDRPIPLGVTPGRLGAIPVSIGLAGAGRALPYQYENEQKYKAANRSPYEELIAQLTGE